MPNRLCWNSARSSQPRLCDAAWFTMAVPSSARSSGPAKMSPVAVGMVNAADEKGGGRGDFGGVGRLGDHARLAEAEHRVEIEGARARQIRRDILVVGLLLLAGLVGGRFSPSWPVACLNLHALGYPFYSSVFLPLCYNFYYYATGEYRSIRSQISIGKGRDVHRLPWT